MTSKTSRDRSSIPEGMTPEEFDLWWTGEKPDPDCPSCHGTGWATIRSGGITFAGGRCRCRPNGTVWAGPKEDE